MRISDWSSDVCSSDLPEIGFSRSRSAGDQCRVVKHGGLIGHQRNAGDAAGGAGERIGREYADIDETGRDDGAARVDAPGARRHLYERQSVVEGKSVF